MRINSSEVKANIREHIIYHVEKDGQSFDTFKEAAVYLYNEFERVSNNPLNHQKFPNDFDRFSDYLLGLPFSFYYYFNQMEAYLNALGLSKQVKKCKDDSDKLQRLYHHLIFSSMMRAVENAQK
jgi:hypothetical protein